jgi:hypothetical protein
MNDSLMLKLDFRLHCVASIQAPLMNEWLAPLQIRPVRGSYMTLLEKDTSVI